MKVNLTSIRGIRTTFARRYISLCSCSIEFVVATFRRKLSARNQLTVIFDSLSKINKSHPVRIDELSWEAPTLALNGEGWGFSCPTDIVSSDGSINDWLGATYGASMDSRKQSFHLSEHQRERLRSDIDMSALEALLGLVPEELRAIILAALEANCQTDAFAGLCQKNPTVLTVAPHPRSLLPRQVELPGEFSDLQFEDPHLQSLLEAVVASMRPGTH